MRLRLVLLLLAIVTIVYANQTHNKKKAAHHKTAVHHAAHHPARAVHHKAVHHATHKRAATHKKTGGGKKRKGTHKKGQKTIRGLRVRANRRNQKTCSNLALNCKSYLGFCGMSEFVSIMKKFCKLECGHCQASGNDCRDHHPQCAKYKRAGFCKGSVFNRDMKRAFCAKSCGLCLNCSKNKFATDCLPETCPKKANQNNSKCKTWCRQHKGKCSGTTPTTTTTTTPAPGPGSGSGSGSGRPAPPTPGSGSGSGSGSGRPTPGSGSGSGSGTPPRGGSGSGTPPRGGGGSGSGSGSGSGARG